ncbi:hypothetical protein DIPPA_12082 [Diplonema papillatum]|nr:hypothetical protein DIPPA_12082 [Diplonema papillatum]
MEANCRRIDQQLCGLLESLIDLEARSGDGSTRSLSLSPLSVGCSLDFVDSRHTLQRAGSVERFQPQDPGGNPGYQCSAGSALHRSSPPQFQPSRTSQASAARAYSAQPPHGNPGAAGSSHRSPPQFQPCVYSAQPPHGGPGAAGSGPRGPVLSHRSSPPQFQPSPRSPHASAACAYYSAQLPAAAEVRDSANDAPPPPGGPPAAEARQQKYESVMLARAAQKAIIERLNSSDDPPPRRAGGGPADGSSGAGPPRFKGAAGGSNQSRTCGSVTASPSGQGHAASSPEQKAAGRSPVSRGGRPAEGCSGAGAPRFEGAAGGSNCSVTAGPSGQGHAVPSPEQNAAGRSPAGRKSDDPSRGLDEPGDAPSPAPSSQPTSPAQDAGRHCGATQARAPAAKHNAATSPFQQTQIHAATSPVQKTRRHNAATSPIQMTDMRSAAAPVKRQSTNAATSPIQMTTTDKCSAAALVSRQSPNATSPVQKTRQHNAGTSPIQMTDKRSAAALVKRHGTTAATSPVQTTAKRGDAALSARETRARTRRQRPTAATSPSHHQQANRRPAAASPARGQPRRLVLSPCSEVSSCSGSSSISNPRASPRSSPGSSASGRSDFFAAAVEAGVRCAGCPGSGGQDPSHLPKKRMRRTQAEPAAADEASAPQKHRSVFGPSVGRQQGGGVLHAGWAPGMAACDGPDASGRDPRDPSRHLSGRGPPLTQAEFADEASSRWAAARSSGGEKHRSGGSSGSSQADPRQRGGGSLHGWAPGMAACDGPDASGRDPRDPGAHLSGRMMPLTQADLADEASGRWAAARSTGREKRRSGGSSGSSLADPRRRSACGWAPGMAAYDEPEPSPSVRSRSASDSPECGSTGSLGMGGISTPRFSGWWSPGVDPPPPDPSCAGSRDATAGSRGTRGTAALPKFSPGRRGLPRARSGSAARRPAKLPPRSVTRSGSEHASGGCWFGDAAGPSAAAARGGPSPASLPPRSAPRSGTDPSASPGSRRPLEDVGAGFLNAAGGPAPQLSGSCSAAAQRRGAASTDPSASPGSRRPLEDVGAGFLNVAGGPAPQLSGSCSAAARRKGAAGTDPPAGCAPFAPASGLYPSGWHPQNHQPSARPSNHPTGWHPQNHQPSARPSNHPTGWHPQNHQPSARPSNHPTGWHPQDHQPSARPSDPPSGCGSRGCTAPPTGAPTFAHGTGCLPEDADPAVPYPRLERRPTVDSLGLPEKQTRPPKMTLDGRQNAWMYEPSIQKLWWRNVNRVPLREMPRTRTQSRSPTPSRPY